MQRTRRDRRRRCPPVQRDKLLAAYRRSGLTQKAYAAQVGIGYSAAWLGKAATARLAHLEGGASVFIPMPNLLSAADPVPAYRFAFPGGLQVAVARSFHPDELQALLQVSAKGGHFWNTCCTL